MSSFAYPLQTAAVDPSILQERICPVQVDSLHPDYRQVKPLEELTPFRKTTPGAKPYHPDVSDLVVVVEADHIEEYKGKNRILYSLLENELIDASIGKDLPDLVKEDLADCRLSNCFKLIAGHPVEDAIHLRDLMYLDNITQRLTSFYTFLEPQDPDRPVPVDFTAVLPTALKGVKPHPAYWKVRDMTMHWLDPGMTQVYAIHPRDSTVVSSTDMSDALLQTFFVCKGVYVTGSDYHSHFGYDYATYNVKTRAPLFTVSQALCKTTYKEAGERALDYLGWMGYWHSPLEVPNRRPRVCMSDRWKEDRATKDYPLTKFKLGLDLVPCLPGQHRTVQLHPDAARPVP